MATITWYDINEKDQEHVEKTLKSHKHTFIRESISERNADPNAEIISGFIYSKIPSAIIAKLSNVKLIATRSTGFDHIDIRECKQRSIMVANVPSYGENTVAEHTFGILLSLTRNIHLSDLRTRGHDYTLEGLTGIDIKGKTIGLIGGGRIGLHVAKMAKAFGMRVLMYDVFQQPFIAELIGFEYVPLDTLLSESDVISLHAPYMKETHHILNVSNMGKIKKGAILINTSRGGLIETEALLTALDSRMILAAGLDVIEGEEELTKNGSSPAAVLARKIIARDDVLFTAHNAFNSREALQRILDITCKNIEAFTAGKPQNVIQ